MFTPEQLAKIKAHQGIVTLTLFGRILGCLGMMQRLPMQWLFPQHWYIKYVDLTAEQLALLNSVALRNCPK
jgi:hypothetical protein